MPTLPNDIRANEQELQDEIESKSHQDTIDEAEHLMDFENAEDLDLINEFGG